MKIYFPDDLLKQEMLEALINMNDCRDNNYNYFITFFHGTVKPLIEKATGKPITEVIK